MRFVQFLSYNLNSMGVYYVVKNTFLVRVLRDGRFARMFFLGALFGDRLATS